MKRKRKAKVVKRRLPDPLDVLAGRVEIGCVELFDLIHEINPTGRELSAKESAARYQLKSRLQSLLIRRFGDEHLLVTKDRGDVASLEHRFGDRDACHTVVSELDVDARAWVRRQLDFDSVSSPAEEDEELPDLRAVRSLPEDEAPLAELVAGAQRATQEYDYEAAQRLFALAFERSGGAASVAVPLLDLLVGMLGMDREAREIEPRLSAAAREQPAVRVLLALAAARTGDAVHALELVRGAEAARTADVYAVLAEQAIAGRDRRAASRHLEAVVERHPAHPQVQRLTDAIADLRAEDLRPAEQELQRRYEGDGALAVEEEARDLAQRWPQSGASCARFRSIAGKRRSLPASSGAIAPTPKDGSKRRWTWSHGGSAASCRGRGRCRFSASTSPGSLPRRCSAEPTSATPRGIR